MISASEARALCPPSTTEQIFESVESKARVGGTETIVRTVLLLPETREALLMLGYSIRDKAGIDNDLTVISW